MTTPTYTSTTSDEITIRTLNEATASLQIKSEVQSVLNTIISDIETTHQIETKLNHEYEVYHYQQRCENAERALEEYKAIEKERNESARNLVQEFVNDLGGLTGLMRELKLEKERVNSDGHVGSEENEQKVNEGHEGTSSNENNEEVDAAMSGTSNPTTTNNEVSTTNETTKKVNEGETRESQTTEEIKVTDNTNETDAARKDTDAPVNIPENEQNEQNSPTIVPVPAPSSSTTTIIKQKRTIKKLKKVKRHLPPTLQSLNSATLMKIFEFMDAMDIVNMAQTNVRMYSKVDSIFGLGGAGLDADGRDGDEDEFEEVWVEVEEEVEEDVEVAVGGEKDDRKSDDGDGQVEASASSSTSSGSKPVDHATIVSIPSTASGTIAAKPTKVAIPAKTTANLQQNTSSSSSIPTTKPESSTEQSPQVIPTSTKPPPPAPTSKPSTTSSTSSTSSGGFQISSAVAAALADKLSPIELSAIITMRDQLRIKEQETNKMREELNALNATLDGTLSVKEVLTVKVKEQQLALDQNKEIAAKMNRQTSSDQEVIAFLDERVQELERQVGNFDKERMKIQGDIDTVKKSSEKQLSVLGDMLTFEREQMADHEKEWKSTKKVLVKEVKHLRAQILALEAERDGYYEENMKLKEALLSVGSSSKASKSFEYS